MKYQGFNLLMESNETYKFVNSDGFTINTDDKDYKTKIKFLGKCANQQKLKRFLMAIDPELLKEIKKESRTEIELEARIYSAFVHLTAKVNPEVYLLNQAKCLYPRERQTTWLTKTSFLFMFNSPDYKVVDWDIEKTYAFVT